MKVRQGCRRPGSAHDELITLLRPMDPDCVFRANSERAAQRLRDRGNPPSEFLR